MENTTVIVPMMLFGWVPLSILFFWILKPHHAVLVSILGGWLFLPMAAYNLPGIPEYGKDASISLGLILGGLLSGHKRETSFQLKIYDIPILLWCICPVATSLFNGLGLYDGLSAAIKNIAAFGVPYFVGRYYFDSAKSLRDICVGIIIGGMIYIPFCLWEVRMSPQLHKMIYGFFQHSFDQHVRYGGFRPIVFMQHGLMVSLWMAVSSVITFWYWQSSEKKNLMWIPLMVVFFSLVVTTLLCKSANGWTILILGVGLYFLYKKLNVTRSFQILVLIIPLYFILRIPNLLSIQEITSVASIFFDEERVASLIYRLTQEDLICVEVLKQPLLGWGRFGRGLPVDVNTGEVLIYVRDSLWLISFQTYGFVGLICLYASLLLGPFLIFKNYEKLTQFGSDSIHTLIVALSLTVVFFSIDSLFNSMRSPIYIAISGALISFSLKLNKVEKNGERINA